MADVQRAVDALLETADVATAASALATLAAAAADATQTTGPCTGPEPAHLSAAAYAAVARAALADRVVLHWLPCLDSQTRRSTFDAIFVQSSMPEVALIVLSDALRTVPGRPARSPVTDMAAELARTLAINRLSDICRNILAHARPTVVGEHSAHVGALCSLPDRLANARGAPEPASSPVAHEGYFRRLCQCLFEVYESLPRTAETSALLATLLGRITLLGHALAVSDVLARTSGTDIMPLLPNLAIEPLVCAMLHDVTQQCCSLDSVVALVAPVFGPNGHVQYLLTSKLMLAEPRRLFGEKELQALIDLLWALDGTHGAIARALLGLLAVWSDASIMRRTLIESQVYWTSGVLLCLRKMRQDAGCIGRHQGALQAAVMNGVQAYLACPDGRQRRLGMIVGEQFAAVLTPGNPLKFDYPVDAEAERLVALAKNSDDVPARAPGRPAVATATVTAPHSSRAEMPGSASGDRPGDDPDALFFEHIQDSAEEPTASVAHDQLAPDPHSDRDSVSSLSSLEPFETANDVSQPVAVASSAHNPWFVRDIIAQLESSDDPDRLEASLRAVPDAVLHRPADLDDMSADLARALLYLQDRFEMRDFAAIRRRALTVITVASPGPVAQCLIAEFYDRSIGYAQRLDILQAICDAADELSRSSHPCEASGTLVSAHRAASSEEHASRQPATVRGNALGHERDRAEPHHGHDTDDSDADDVVVEYMPTRGPLRLMDATGRIRSVTEMSARRSPGAADSVVRARLAAKTRELLSESARARRKERSAVPAASALAPVAGAFFYGLMRGYDCPAAGPAGFDLLSADDCLLLSRLCFTLGHVLRTVGPHPLQATSMAIALLDFTWGLHWHAHPLVRRAILFDLAVITYVSSAEQLVADAAEQLAEARCWLETVCRDDPDTECRTLAHAVLVAIAALWSPVADGAG